MEGSERNQHPAHDHGVVEGDFAPLEHLAISGDIIGCHNPGRGGTRGNTGMRWVETKDVAEYPLDSTPADPPNKAYSAQNASSAVVGKPCYVGGRLGLL